MSYFQRFKKFESEYFWLEYPTPKTLFRISVFLQGTEIAHHLSPSGVGEHAEVEALKNIKLKLITQLQNDSIANDESAVLNLVVRLNNSPCHDKKCQSYITQWIQEIQKLIPKASFRFILYFSNFYLEYKSACPIGTVLKYQTEWIVELVELGVVVIFCPIVVSEMVPKYFPTLRANVNMMEQYDIECLRNFQSLLKKLNAKKLNIFKSNNFSIEYKRILLNIFTYKPQYISAYPKGMQHLSKLPTEYSIPRVKYHPYNTRSSKRTN